MECGNGMTSYIPSAAVRAEPPYATIQCQGRFEGHRCGRVRKVIKSTSGNKAETGSEADHDAAADPGTGWPTIGTRPPCNAPRAGAVLAVQEPALMRRYGFTHTLLTL